MSQIWYVGKADTRTISAADWIAAGVAGGQAAVTWNAASQWSNSQTLFNAAALTWLAGQPDFQTVGTDTFPVRATYNPGAPAALLPRYVPNRKVTGATTANSGELVLAGGAGGYSVACAQGFNGAMYAVMNDGAGVVTVTVPVGATLKGLVDNAGQTITVGLNGTVALTVNGLVQLVTDGTDYRLL
jgi:hypothetical protein